MKELGRIKIENGWLLIIVDYLELKEIVEDNPDWDYISNVKKKIPTIDISFSRRKAHKEKLKNRCERSKSDYLLLRSIMKIITKWLLKEKPELLYVGAINDAIFKKRVKFYKKFFYRNGYSDYDNKVAFVECVDNSYSIYWLMKKNV